MEEAEATARAATLFNGGDKVTLCLLAQIMIATDRNDKAVALRVEYRRRFGDNKYMAILDRLIAADPAGRDDTPRHFREGEAADVIDRVPWDETDAQRVFAEEEAESPRLKRVARVADADLLFRLGDARRDEALSKIDAAPADDDDDAYARVVKAPAVPEYREA